MDPHEQGIGDCGDEFESRAGAIRALRAPVVVLAPASGVPPGLWWAVEGPQPDDPSSPVTSVTWSAGGTAGAGCGPY
jgi:hypothetical protein